VVQQDLNPGLALPYFAANYPNYVAGFNSLYFPNTNDLSDPNLGKIDKTAFHTVLVSVRHYGREQEQACPQASHTAAKRLRWFGLGAKRPDVICRGALRHSVRIHQEWRQLCLQRGDQSLPFSERVRRIWNLCQ
jgi:hypothetical protein